MDEETRSEKIKLLQRNENEDKTSYSNYIKGI